ncbi:hypothetical protein D9758_016856 [Tetrapyrgos nigripes]|uniref:Uncharacterized protein n=1 Tax=Tetrapyrgos nigripes TaxID=182062 RepID=A0A8H5FKX7_9AGAR|nr:hypothetical protein D9758_016856 [Tetrapyrgos nigripes]
MGLDIPEDHEAQKVPIYFAVYELLTPEAPVTLLSQGLSTLPSLFTISTQLPKEWNDVLLTVSKNERSEKIALWSDSLTATPGSKKKKMSGDASGFEISEIVFPHPAILLVTPSRYTYPNRPPPTGHIHEYPVLLWNRSQTMPVGFERLGWDVSASMPSVATADPTTEAYMVIFYDGFRYRGGIVKLWLWLQLSWGHHCLYQHQDNR